MLLGITYGQLHFYHRFMRSFGSVLASIAQLPSCMCNGNVECLLDWRFSLNATYVFQEDGIEGIHICLQLWCIVLICLY